MAGGSVWSCTGGLRGVQPKPREGGGHKERKVLLAGHARAIFSPEKGRTRVIMRGISGDSLGKGVERMQ